MKIAVIGADTKLGRLIAKDALHRHYEVTAVVKVNDWADAFRYTMVESAEYALPEGEFDAVIDARENTVTIKTGNALSTLLPPAELDEDAVRTGIFTWTEGPGTYLSLKDYAIAAVDGAEGRAPGSTFSATSERAVPPDEDGTGRRRFVARTDKGISGKVFHLVMDNIGEYVVHFTADDTLMMAKKGGEFESYHCYCFHCDDEVWNVCFLKGDECISMILDEAQRLVTMVIGRLEPHRPTLVKLHEYQFGAIQMFNEELPFRRHGFTDDLVGEKICWHYSPYSDITHCYINENYMRSSLHNMRPLPEGLPWDAYFDVEDRAERWGRIFFEESAQYVRINPHLYIMSMIELQRNRIDTLQGGGDMVIAINTRRVHDYGIGFNSGTGVANMILFSVRGDFDDVKVPFETEPSPFHT